MKCYVVGFAFDHDKQNVVLMHKNRPDWQKGKLNGIGGHIEPQEHPVEAMRREFIEEAGVDIFVDRWADFAMMQDTNKQFVCYCYSAVLTRDEFAAVKTQTDEEVLRVAVEDVGTWPRIPNLDWLIPLALNQMEGKLRHVLATYTDPS